MGGSEQECENRTPEAAGTVQGGPEIIKKSQLQPSEAAVLTARKLAVPRGLEPLTFGLGNRCSVQLSYGTVFRRVA